MSVTFKIAKPKLKKISVRHNIWGNWCGFIGTVRTYDSASKFNATYWLMEQYQTGKYLLSEKTDISKETLVEYANRLGIVLN